MPTDSRLLPLPSALHARLRAATAAAHEALEIELELLSPPLDPQRFRRVLAGFYGFHRAWEPAVVSCLPATLVPASRLPLIEQDLRALGWGDAELRASVACAPAAALADSAESALGSVYVLEGSTLGGRVIMRQVSQAAWCPPQGLRYFDPYGAETAARWRATLAHLADARGDSDLIVAAREPIHIPGAIQPHGCLLTLARDSLRILQVSANGEAFLGRHPVSLCGEPIAAILDAGQEEALREALRASPETGGGLSRLDIGGRAFDASVSAGSDVVLLELEPAEGDDAGTTSAGIQQALRRLAQCDTFDRLVDVTARAVRELTGFDRVMVYRFDSDDHGEVIAEAKGEALEPYLGLHYPESDIPRQARALYLRHWVRCIPNARYAPVPLVPPLRPDTGLPLDLSDSILRSVSPVHLEYMANMGVQASMSVSLIVAGRLWGLISAGHRTPHAFPQRLRSACETIGQVVSLQLGALEALEFRRHQEQKADLIGVRMSALLHDLLDLAKIEAGRFAVAPSLQNAGKLVQDAFELMEAVGLATNVEIVLEGAADVPVMADPERIFQVFSNLIGNAIKHGGAGGCVRVGAAPAGGMCEFWVADSGPGIPVEHLANIFDRYWQGKQSDSAGAGLGLFIARGIVDAHGGALRARSTPGEGATFAFTLPLA